MARRVPFGAVILSTTLLVAACSGSGAASTAGDRTTGAAATSAAQGSGSGTDGTTSTTGGGGPGTTAGGGGGSTGGGGSGGGGSGGGGSSAGFQYTPWGPDDPPIPEQYAAFATSSPQQLNCDAVSQVSGQGQFWDLAGKVCLALKSNQGWPDTTSVPPPPKADNAYMDCLNGELAAMLERALQWHAANPGRSPVIQYPSRSSTSPCQSRIYEVTVLPASDPDSTPGKVAVEVLAPAGKNSEDFSVTVDGVQRDPSLDDFVGDGLRKAVVLLDPPAQDHDAPVVVDNGRGTRTTHIHLTATNGAGNPANSPSPSDTASPNG